MFASEPLPSIAAIRERLASIFPEGLSDRNYLVREVAARIVFTMLYIDAVEGQGHKLAPVHVYRMSDAQAAIQADEQRVQYRDQIMGRSYKPIGTRWFADNSREAVRDESLRDGLCVKGAVLADRSISVTSSRGRYVLQRAFAELFTIPEASFAAAAANWRERFLSAAELARVRILRERPTENSVTVRLPSGESRNIAVGPSGTLTRAVVEEFAPRFLTQPHVLWISDSREHVVLQDDKLMRSIGLPIDESRLLPDLVLADLNGPMRLFFVEIVATDGPFTVERRNEVLRMTEAAGFPRSSVFFVSAFEHRNVSPLKRRFAALAENTFVWCMAEPELLIWITTGQAMPLSRTTWTALKTS